ncbi:helix-turn-helix transcriptional regulator [Erysipelothrix anatis]|uniref:helix-turn-helix transcriptional regulator n=1 Tax=Erysipelothrix anatis TaxID=2683713 RepID=UPI00135B7C9C|nr:WYL domain-containing transcriptional regulator [Erysipelothrix anatis]
MSKLTNALAMLDILSARAIVPIDELAQALEISARSVQRLKEELEDAGYVIETVMGPGGGYQLHSRSQIPPVAFDMKERKLLKQALAMVIQHNNSAMGGDFVRAVSKLSQQLNYQDVSNTMAFQSVKLNVDVKQYQEHLELIEVAIETHQRLKLSYKKTHKDRNTYTFEPYELILVNQFWYMMGYDERNRYLSLKVNRIETLTMLDETFRYEAPSNSKGAITEFGYKIKPVQATLIVRNLDFLSEYIWGKNQVITWLDDHRFHMELEFPNEAAAKDFIRKGGANLEVLAPLELRMWIQDEAQKIIAKYD